ATRAVNIDRPVVLIVDDFQKTLGGLGLWIFPRPERKVYIAQIRLFSLSFRSRDCVGAQVKNRFHPEHGQSLEIIARRLATSIDAVVYLPEILDDHFRASESRFPLGIGASRRFS